jgi:hypothetical protein
MSAPTEAEIRTLLAEREQNLPNDRVSKVLEEAVDKAFQVITYTELDADGRYDFGVDALTDVWANLDPIEQAELTDVVELAKGRAQEAAHEAIRIEIVMAAVAFGASHPHAERVPREAVSA